MTKYLIYNDNKDPRWANGGTVLIGETFQRAKCRLPVQWGNVGGVTVGGRTDVVSVGVRISVS